MTKKQNRDEFEGVMGEKEKKQKGKKKREKREEKREIGVKKVKVKTEVFQYHMNKYSDHY